MSSIDRQIAEIEKELLALTGDQPPNPAQIVTYRVTRTTTAVDEIKTIVFDDGTPRFIQAFGAAFVYEELGDLKAAVVGGVGTVYDLVSLGAFSLV